MCYVMSVCINTRYNRVVLLYAMFYLSLINHLTCRILGPAQPQLVVNLQELDVNQVDNEIIREQNRDVNALVNDLTSMFTQ